MRQHVERLAYWGEGRREQDLVFLPEEVILLGQVSAEELSDLGNEWSSGVSESAPTAQFVSETPKTNTAADFHNRVLISARLATRG